jgi:hypothetical protein
MSRESFLNRTLVSAAAALTLLLVTRGGPSGAAEPQPEGKLRVLVVTGGHDYEKQPFEAMFAAIPDIEAKQVTYPDAAQLLTPSLTETCDAIVFYDMWAQGITPEQQQAFVALLEKGIGIVALHHTLGAHANWPEYDKIIGGRFQLADRVVDGKTLPRSGYDHDQDIAVKVADAEHPITRGLKDFSIHDETYCRYDTDPQARVLLTTDHPKSDPELAWVKQYGRSRVFYLQLGHDHLAYENPSFRELVARGIRWSAGRPADPTAAAQPLFNGRDLAGWRTEGSARWEAKDGQLIGRQGENGAAGELLTDATYGDFELRVTFRVEWPANSGVWYRYQSPQQAYQADILEYQQPFALTGSLYCTGKMFIAVNDKPEIVNREGWNTLLIRAVGDRQVVLLNGTKVADVRDTTSDCGRIGFQVHAGDQFTNMRIVVKDICLRPI